MCLVLVLVHFKDNSQPLLKVLMTIKKVLIQYRYEGTEYSRATYCTSTEYVLSTYGIYWYYVSTRTSHTIFFTGILPE